MLVTAMMHRAHEVQHLANAGKVELLDGVSDEYSLLVNHFSEQMTAEFWAGLPLSSVTTRGKSISLTRDSLPFSTGVPQRMMELAYVDAHGKHASHRELLHKAVTKTVMRSSLSPHEKATLVRLSHHRTYPTLTAGTTLTMHTLPDGTLSHDRVRGASGAHEPVEVLVEPRLVRMLQDFIKILLKKRLRLPRIKTGRTMVLDTRMARVEESKTSSLFTHWLVLPSLVSRQKIRIPIRLNERVDTENLTGAQVLVRGGDLTIKLTTKEEVAPLRAEGRSVGLDWGLTSMFATSDGNHHGRRFLQWLRVMDAQITTLERELNRSRVRFRDSVRWQNLRARVEAYTKNEVNRVLNKVAADDVREIVVEDLDFRHGGLSRRMNRLLTLAGRAAVKRKLSDLTARRGVLVTEVNPAYTSQECSSCGYVRKSNRRGARFKCLHCGEKTHADTNAARVVMGRSRDKRSWQWVSREEILGLLGDVFEVRHGYPMPEPRRPV